MGKYRAAKRYANSLLSLALEKKVEDKVTEDMEMFKAVTQENRDFEFFLKSPVVSADKKAETLKKIFDGKINSLTSDSLDLICKNGRADHLSIITDQYLELYKESKNILVAEVTSAAPMDKSLENSLKSKISENHSGDIEMNNKVKPDLIGGFILKIKDRQVDVSVSRKLNDLKKVFNAN